MKPRPQTAWVAVWIGDDGSAPLDSAEFIARTRDELIPQIQPYIPSEWRLVRVTLTPAKPAKKGKARK